MAAGAEGSVLTQSVHLSVLCRPTRPQAAPHVSRHPLMTERGTADATGRLAGYFYISLVTTNTVTLSHCLGIPGHTTQVTSRDGTDVENAGELSNHKFVRK